MPSLRASDADREQVAERLRHATAEGRLTADELDQRLDALYASRTYGELDVLVADLPARSTRRRSPAPVRRRWVGAACGMAVLLAVLGMVAGTVRHSAAAAAGPGHPIVIGAPGPGVAAHALLAAVGSAISVFAVVLVFAAVVWLLVRSQRPSDA